MKLLSKDLPQLVSLQVVVQKVGDAGVVPVRYGMVWVDHGGTSKWWYLVW